MSRQTARGVALIALYLAATVIVSQEVGAVVSGPEGTTLLMLLGGVLGMFIGLPGLLMILDGGRRS